MIQATLITIAGLLALLALFLAWSFWLATNSESNCLFYALMKFRQMGGYLIMRKSRHSWFPHFLWSADLHTFKQYVPQHPVNGLKWPPCFFAGMIRSGDDTPLKEQCDPHE